MTQRGPSRPALVARKAAMVLVMDLRVRRDDVRRQYSLRRGRRLHCG